MQKGRLEAFSDGVIAIIITIMVLELKAPKEKEWAALLPLVPKVLSYLLSFSFVGIYWNNHHHMLQACHRVNGAILWANLHLLFWLSLIPFTTAWVAETGYAEGPVSLYGFILLLSAVAYTLLQAAIVKEHGSQGLLRAAVGNDLKGKLSVSMYIVAIALSFWKAWPAMAIYVAVALLWLVPDRRIVKVVKS